ncbi:hypothetical protein J6590_084249 [Homalodisca vitripennis]|nr:hypothetical protein J6590_084249 [Homalodisca vitripennis]
MFCKLYDVEGELILINGSGWSAGIIPPHLMLVSNPTPQPLLPFYCPSPPQTMKRCGYDPTTTVMSNLDITNWRRGLVGGPDSSMPYRKISAPR